MDIKDLVTLSDKNKYQVISKTVYKEKKYYYLIDINNISNQKILYENKDHLTELNDQELINTLAPKLLKEIKDLL